MPHSTIDAPPAVNPVATRLSGAMLRLPSLSSSAGLSPTVYTVKKADPNTIDVLETGERFRLSNHYLAKIENRAQEGIGYVRLGVDWVTRNVYAFKEITRRDAGSRALEHLHDEQHLGLQAGSDIAGRTLLRSESREYLMLPAMAGDLTSMRESRGRGRDAAMLLGMRAVLRDLAQCHQRGVAHRDIKPGNVLHRGTLQSIRLGDFGLSRSTSYISHGVGTPNHMAPEQHWSRINRITGHASIPADIWGVGATFLDIWVGNPFVNTSAEERTQIHEAYARWHPRTKSSWRWRVGGKDTTRFTNAFGKLPNSVRPMMLRLMHPNPNKRPSVNEARADIERLLAQTPDHTYAEQHYATAAIKMCNAWNVDSLQ